MTSITDDASTPGLRWGVLATGQIARRFTGDALAAGLDVAAVGSRSAGSAQSFAEEFGVPRAHGSYEELAADDDVDIVYVATPHPSHCENALLALRQGKHVLVEKPFTVNRAEAERIREASQAAGLLALEAMWTRYLPHMVRIRDLLLQGAIGEVRTLFADHNQRLPTDPAHRINALELGGGALLDLGVYPISFAWDVLGAPETIHASARFGETGADTEVAAVLRHASGALSTSMSSSRAVGPNTAHIVGTEGRIDISRVWYTPSGFTLTAPDGVVLEEYACPEGEGGMHHQAIAAERLVADGDLTGGLLSLDESVQIMGTLDEIRRQVGLAYPDE